MNGGFLEPEHVRRRQPRRHAVQRRGIHFSAISEELLANPACRIRKGPGLSTDMIILSIEITRLDTFNRTQTVRLAG
jgi:hypothetical protein